MRRLLVTAGSTSVALDRVRVLVNIFRGRTGEQIARVAAEKGWDVTLLSSAPTALQEHNPGIRRRGYRTFEDLESLMEQEITTGRFDAIVHSAAVGDFKVAAMHVIKGVVLERLELRGPSAAKIPSNHDRLFVELVPAKKLVDQIRSPWGFTGKLVKFKLQADMPDEQLLEIAHGSRLMSKADIIVANCLEWCRDYAYIVSQTEMLRVSRNELAEHLIARL